MALRDRWRKIKKWLTTPVEMGEPLRAVRREMIPPAQGVAQPRPEPLLQPDGTVRFRTGRLQPQSRHAEAPEPVLVPRTKDGLGLKGPVANGAPPRLPSGPGLSPLPDNRPAGWQFGFRHPADLSGGRPDAPSGDRLIASLRRIAQRFPNGGVPEQVLELVEVACGWQVTADALKAPDKAASARAALQTELQRFRAQPHTDWSKNRKFGHGAERSAVYLPDAAQNGLTDPERNPYAYQAGLEQSGSTRSEKAAIVARRAVESLAGYVRLDSGRTVVADVSQSQPFGFNSDTTAAAREKQAEDGPRTVIPFGYQAKFKPTVTLREVKAMAQAIAFDTGRSVSIAARDIAWHRLQEVAQAEGGDLNGKVPAETMSRWAATAANQLMTAESRDVRIYSAGEYLAGPFSDAVETQSITSTVADAAATKERVAGPQL